MRTTVEFDEKLVKEIKKYCLEHDIKLRDFFTDAAKSKLKK